MEEMKEYSDEVDIQRIIQIISDYAITVEELKKYIEPRPRSQFIDGPMAPMGIAVYGIKEGVYGQHSTFTVVTNAVRGVVDIPPDISVSSYQRNGSRYGKLFSVQLNAFVVAVLKNRMAEYYWVQNVVGTSRIHKELEVDNNIWDTTDPASTIPNAKGRGRIVRRPDYGGYYYHLMSDPIPFGRVELETRTYVKNDKVIVEFYANEQKYDEVVIRTRAPATSAHMVAALAAPSGYPLVIELVLGGRNIDIPYAVLHDGRIGLELYVNENDKWVPPPSAWSVGSVIPEFSYARVMPRSVGSAMVVPGEPNLQQLW